MRHSSSVGVVGHENISSIVGNRYPSQICTTYMSKNKRGDELILNYILLLVFLIRVRKYIA